MHNQVQHHCQHMRTGKGEDLGNSRPSLAWVPGQSRKCRVGVEEWLTAVTEFCLGHTELEEPTAFVVKMSSRQLDI